MFCTNLISFRSTQPLHGRKMSASTSRGLRLLKSIQKYVNSRPHQWDTATVLSKVNMEYAADGVIKGKFVVEQSMCNSGATLHGGYVSSLVDVMALFSCLSHDRGRLAWSTGLHVQFLNAAKEGEEVTVETTPLTIGRSSAVVVTLRNSGDAVLAQGSVSLVAGSDHWQKIATEVLHFDPMEK